MIDIKDSTLIKSINAGTSTVEECEASNPTCTPPPSPWGNGDEAYFREKITQNGNFIHNRPYSHAVFVGAVAGAAITIIGFCAYLKVQNSGN